MNLFSLIKRSVHGLGAVVQLSQFVSLRKPVNTLKARFQDKRTQFVRVLKKHREGCLSS